MTATKFISLIQFLMSQGSVPLKTSTNYRARGTNSVVLGAGSDVAECVLGGVLESEDVGEVDG